MNWHVFPFKVSWYSYQHINELKNRPREILVESYSLIFFKSGVVFEIGLTKWTTFGAHGVSVEICPFLKALSFILSLSCKIPCTRMYSGSSGSPWSRDIFGIAMNYLSMTVLNNTAIVTSINVLIKYVLVQTGLNLDGQWPFIWMSYCAFSISMWKVSGVD